MLSINIPVYNTDVESLAREVRRQAALERIDFEIRVYDDGSETGFRNMNRKLAELDHVIYIELPKNLGRSAIRNKMGLDSKKDYLLFIDSDSVIDSDNYLHNYIEEAYPGCIISGGTKYRKQKPADPSQLLRWVYGCKREAIPAADRYRQKGFIITSNNFLIDRKVFEKVHFRENIGPYGHEDTLLGYDLFMNNFVPHHINNPVVHVGLENSRAFLEKTEKALENLLFIQQEVVGNSLRFSEKIRFLKQYKRLTRYFSPVLIGFFFRIFRRLIVRNLTGKHPILMCFDLYKVGYFSVLKNTGY